MSGLLGITEKDTALVRFLWNVQETVAAMEEALTRLRSEGASLELIERLSYLAYRVREDARSAGLEEVSQLARILENMFEQARKGQVEMTSDLLSLLRPSCAALVRMAAGCEDGDEEMPELAAAAAVESQ